MAYVTWRDGFGVERRDEVLTEFEHEESFYVVVMVYGHRGRREFLTLMIDPDQTERDEYLSFDNGL